MDYERGHLTVTLANGTALVPYEIIGYTTCPRCERDTIPTVARHTPAGISIGRLFCDDCHNDD